MNILGTVALWAWVPVVLVFFGVLGPRRGILAGYFLGALFLPEAGFRIPSFVAYDKLSATSIAVVIGILLFDHERLKSFRPSVFDLPMLVWVGVPFASMLSNDFAVRDAAFPMLEHVFDWGIPYFCARLYIDRWSGLRDLVFAIALAGLVYVPLCLFELRMSPRLHADFYGFHQRAFMMLDRYGGYRPLVFLQSPLMVGMLMATSSLVVFWSWRAKILERFGPLPIRWATLVLVVTTILGKTSGAMTLMFLGMLICTTSRRAVGQWMFAGIVFIGLLYPPLRASGILDRERALAPLIAVYDEERIKSLSYRMINEDLLAAHAAERAWLGWGGWGRESVYDEEGRKVSTQDGLWIIVFGKYGLIGLAAIMGVHLVPALLLLRLPSATWVQGPTAMVAVLSVVMGLTWIDKLLNGMPNVVITLTAGALTTAYAVGLRDRSAARTNRRLDVSTARLS